MADGGLSNSELSRRVLTNVERLRAEAGLSTAALIDATSMGRSAFYERKRLETPFTLRDIEELASALGVDGSALTSPVSVYLDRVLRLDGGELGRRLRLAATAIEGFTASAMIDSIFVDGEFGTSDWNDLTTTQEAVTISENTLRRIADYFNVEPAYLVDLGFDTAADRVDAELDLRAAIIESGATSMSMRSFDSASSSALRSIAKVIRSIEK